VSTVRRAARNLGALFTAQLFARITGLLMTAFLARHLGGEYFGTYVLCINFASLFGVLAGLGMRQIVLRHIIHHPDQAPRTVGSAVMAHFAQAAVTVLVVVIVAKLFGYEGRKFYGIVIMSLAVAFMAFESLFYAVLEAYEKMDIEAWFIILRQAVWITLAIIAVLTDEGYLVLLTALLATAVFITMITGFVVRSKFCAFPFRLHGSTTWELLRAGLPLAGAAILVDIYLKIDMVMIDQMIDDRAVGLYGASYRLVHSLLFLSGTFFTVVYPIFSRLYRDDREKLGHAYERSLKIISVALVPAAAGTAALAPQIMRVLYGGEFIGGAQALAIAVWGVAIYGLAVVMGRVLLSLHQQKVIFYVSFTSVITNIILNLVLIPRMGIEGAALASVITVGVVALLNYIAVGRYLHKMPPLIPLLWKVYLAGLLMGAAVWQLMARPLWITIPLGIVLYVALVFLLRVLDETDWAMLRQLTRKGNG
jgi:O-antigen/teichoic acid export membrane protein